MIVHPVCRHLNKRCSCLLAAFQNSCDSSRLRNAWDGITPCAAVYDGPMQGGVKALSAKGHQSDMQLVSKAVMKIDAFHSILHNVFVLHLAVLNNDAT